MMERRLSRAHCLSRFGPYFSFDATAADRAGGQAILKEQHFGATALWRRATRIGHGGHHDALTTLVRLANQSIQFMLRNRAHIRSARILRAIRRHLRRPISQAHASCVLFAGISAGSYRQTSAYRPGVGVGLA